MAVILKKHEVHLINSMFTTQHRAETYTALIATFLADYDQLSWLENEEVKTNIDKNVPKQTNTNDCGVCLCLNLEALTNSKCTEV